MMAAHKYKQLANGARDHSADANRSNNQHVEELSQMTKVAGGCRRSGNKPNQTKGFE